MEEDAWRHVIALARLPPYLSRTTAVRPACGPRTAPCSDCRRARRASFRDPPPQSGVFQDTVITIGGQQVVIRRAIVKGVVRAGYSVHALREKHERQAESYDQ